MMNFRFSVDRDRGAVIVVPAGRLDSTSSPSFDQEVAALVSAGERRMVVDFTDVEYISSAGLRVLMLAAREVKQREGTMALCSLQPVVQEIFEISRFNVVFKVFPDRRAGLAALSKRAAGGPAH